MARKCLFCGGPANSNEHAFPDWLSQIAPGTGDMTHGREGTDHTWNVSGFDIKVKQACRQCNQTWMSDLEVASQSVVTPLVLAQRTTPLPAPEQIKVATWGYKTGIMLALAHPEDQRFVPPEHYAFFYEQQKPPDGTHVWIGALHIAQDSNVYRAGWSKPERLEFRRSNGTIDRYGYRLSFSVIALVFQIVLEPYGNKLGRPRDLRDIWTRIRPISKGEWPPRRWFTVDGLDSIPGGSFVPAS